jgi:Transposase DDE domain
LLNKQFFSIQAVYMTSSWIHYSNRFHAMPYKHNESRRHKIKKSRYKVTNWHDYNNGLRQRGEVTIWFTEEALADWYPEKTRARGRPQVYSDIAIETAVLIRQVFHLPLHQTEGFMNSLTLAINADINIPDFSSISKRSMTLPKHILTKAMELDSIVIVYFTGLQVYSKDELHQEKHAVPARRTLRRLHHAIDENHNVLACELTTPDVGDPTAVPELLDQITTHFKTFMGDAAYDSEPVFQAVLNKQPGTQVVVPAHKNAVCSEAGNTEQNQHIQTIAEQGRIAWQRKTGYNLRSS